MVKRTKYMQMKEKLYFLLYNKIKRDRFQKENANPANRNAVVFFGDSITDNCNLKKYYPQYKALNRGISGNTTTDLLARMNVSVFDAKPSRIVLLIGINDMMNEGKKPDEVAINYEKILTELQTKLPQTAIICQSVYPGWDGDKTKVKFGLVFPIAYLAEDILALNTRIAEICKRHNVTYVDTHSLLEMEDHTMNPAYSFDGVHPNDAGYQVVCKELQKYL